MSKTYKAEIVQDYISKFTHSSTNSIARKLVKDFPLDFKNFDSARTMVRIYRDGHKGRNKAERSPEERKLAMSRYVPKSDYVEVKPFIIPNKHNKLLLLSDIHIPYHDVEAVQLALEYGRKNGMKAIYLNGDTMDCYQASRFTKDRRLRDLAGEIEMVREFLQNVKSSMKVPIYWKHGNHDDRLTIYLRQQAPELLGIPDFELRNILKFNESGIQEISSKQVAKAGNLNILHGHEFGHSVFSPVNPARGLYMRAKENSIIGHHHQTSEHSEKSLNDKVVTTWSVGALCGMKPDYLPFNKWNLGFAMIEFNKDGEFTVDNKRIINGKVM